MHSVEDVHICSSLFLLKLHAWMYNTQQTVHQWCNLTFARWFWATKVCLWARKISKVCLFGHPTGPVTFWKANFENYSRYLLIKCYQFLSVYYSISNTSLYFNYFYILYNFVSIFLLQDIFLSSCSASISYDNLFIFLKKNHYECPYKGCFYYCNPVHFLTSFYPILSRAPSLTFSFNFFF